MAEFSDLIISADSMKHQVAKAIIKADRNKIARIFTLIFDAMTENKRGIEIPRDLVPYHLAIFESELGAKGYNLESRGTYDKTWYISWP